MSLAQQLLIRAGGALLAHAVSSGLTAGAPARTTASCCHLVQMDFADVMTSSMPPATPLSCLVCSCRTCLPLPRMGELECARHPSELRHALEPWHDGRGRAPGGTTVRYVDSSLSGRGPVSGLNDNRYVITVNGRAVPLQPTGRVGEFVAGVRYRAVEPTLGAAPDRRRARAAGVRPDRHLERTLAGRLPIPCGPSGRAQLRQASR